MCLVSNEVRANDCRMILLLLCVEKDGVSERKSHYTTVLISCFE